jgi:hypothetical protein
MKTRLLRLKRQVPWLASSAKVTALILVMLTFLIISTHYPSSVQVPSWDAINAVASLISGTIASISLFFIAYQMRFQARLSKAQFVNELTRDIDLHSEAESNLDREGIWYEEGTLNPDDMEALEKYITFFERVKIILDTNVLDLETIDQLFAYRFFHLVHNPNVQSKILYHPDMKRHFQAVFQLHSLWSNYRKSKLLSLPRDDHELIIN